MQFVFDLDGTICFNGQPVSQTILSAIETVTVQGHDVIFCIGETDSRYVTSDCVCLS
ncbi:HAD hydrolase family protein [Vagococcus penaei]|uniref:HAD hydrolase family protein n=1 Tax=Vagococcus penaei TaxID=633807 RepID=UPI00126024C7